MTKEKKQIKFLMDSELDRNLRWAMYWEKLDSQQGAMIAALKYWFEQNERKHGPPPEDEESTKPKVVPRKRVG